MTDKKIKLEKIPLDEKGMPKKEIVGKDFYVFTLQGFVKMGMKIVSVEEDGSFKSSFGGKYYPYEFDLYRVNIES